MEIWTPRVWTCFAFLLLRLPLCFGMPSPPVSAICPRLMLEGLVEGNGCPIDLEYDFQTKFFPKRGVFKLNGTDLERSLLLLNSRESLHAAVLVHANWCPFSRALLPLFDSLSSSFPSIYHFAVEESALQRSAFSYYGINSFPVLILHNKTAKVRYQGKRTFHAISKFYEDYSGLQPVIHQFKIADESASSKGGERQLLTSPLQEEKLHDDVYLILSFVFLLSRGLFHLLPKFSSAVKQFWADKDASWQAYRSLLHGVIFGKFQRKWDTHTSLKFLTGKNPKTSDFTTQESGKVLLSVPSWPSSSLAAVSFAEGSGSKHGVKGGDM